MTDYYGRRSVMRHGSYSWRRRQVQKKWQNLVSIFITVVLLLALFNGLARGLTLADYLGSSSWSSSSSLAVAAASSPGAVLIYQNDPGRLMLLTFKGNVYWATGNPQKPALAIADIFSQYTGTEMTGLLSQIARVPIGHFLIFENELVADRKSFEKIFKNFASPVTPFKILGKGIDSIADTNLTRGDLIRLWWQVKSLGVDDLHLVDVDAFEELVLPGGQKVSGVDSASLHRTISQYLENKKLFESGAQIVVQNASGAGGAGVLAGDFVTSVGASVKKVEMIDGEREKSQIVAGSENSHEAAYLAKIFECDIKSLPSLNKSEIIVIIGRDFAQKYLK